MPKNKKVFEKIFSKTKFYLFIIAILLIIICILSKRYIIPSIIVYGVILFYSYWNNKQGKAEISNHLKELTFSMDHAAKSTLVNSPFPMVIVQTNGNVIWKSHVFENEFANVDIGSRLNDLLKQIKLEIENKEENENKEIDEKLETETEIYRVLGQYSKQKEEYIVTLYFLKQTEQIALQKKYMDSQICISILMIDNYEEMIQRMEDEQKPQIIATIEKSIYDWVTSFEGLAIKSERDTFVCIFEKKYLEKIEATKFHILDTVKELEFSNKLPITLTISASAEGNTNYEKYKSAQAGLEIALGRGGDQAIVRKEGKYSFFGGRTQEIEKRTKVKARIVSHALEELMAEAKNVMVMGHMNGDIDSMGASMGIYRFARNLGVEAYIINNTTGLSLGNFVEAAKKEKEYEEAMINKAEAMTKITPETLLVVVDTHKKNYVEVPELLEETSKIVVIDHHRKSTDFIEEPMLEFHEVYASSACELVTEILEYAKKEVKLTELEAEALYGGIMMDTKNFTFKTGVRTFEAAAYLRKCGVDIIRVKKWFQSDLKTYNIISKIVEQAEILDENIAISLYEQTNKNANVICAKAADELLTISDITASFVIGKLEDKVCISGRSIGDINVQVILEKLRRRRTHYLSRGTSRRHDN